MPYEDEENIEDGDAEEQDEGGESGVQKADNSISLAERVILNCVTGPADSFEIFAIITVWIPVVGWGVYGIYLLLGAIASAVIFLWSIFRSTGKDAKLAKIVTRRIVIVLAGAVLGEFVPFLRTISINLAISLHNKAAKGRGIMGKVLEEV